MKALQVASWFIAIALFVYFLIVAKHILIPLAIAFSIFYLIDTIADYFGQLKIYRRKLPRWLCLSAAGVIILGILGIAIEIILQSVDNMVVAAPAYQANINNLLRRTLEFFGLSEVPTVTRIMEEVDIRPLIMGIGGGISNIASHFVLIIIYVVFLLLEESSFDWKLRAFFPEGERLERAHRILQRINNSVKTYITVKTLMSLLTGVLSYIVMRIIGVDFAIFWAFLIFLLNYIPSLGSIIATAFPALFALLQFDGLSYFFVVLLAVGGVQLFVGNYLDPRMMGKSLNMSPIVVLLSLVLWGSIWGVIGMVLSVPIMVILMIIMAQFPVTAPIAALLSQTGEIVDLE